MTAKKTAPPTLKKKSPSKKTPVKNKTGRPTLYSQKLAHKICALIASTPRSLKSICKENPTLPDYKTICLWVYKNKEFFELYARARVAQAQILGDDCLDICDDSSHDYVVDAESGDLKVNNEAIARSKVRIDTRKFLVVKLLPKIYGDRMQLTNEDDEDEKLAMRKELAELRSRLDAQSQRDY